MEEIGDQIRGSDRESVWDWINVGAVNQRGHTTD